MGIRSIAIASILFVAATSLPGQREREPKRPKLPVQADTNDAHAYYDFAMELLGRDVDKAADALYWATRLEPTWADAFYARRIALHLSDPRRLTQYWAGDRRTIQSAEIRRIDSLFYHALTLDPFVSQRLDRRLFDAVADEIAKKYDRGSNASQVRALVDQEMDSWPAANRAWHANGNGRSLEALALFAEAIKADERNGPLHVERARVFFNMKLLDSALVELTAATEDLRRRGGKDLVYVYQSKALTEHGIAVVESGLGHVDAARKAYRRALEDDPSYYPAHVQLAHIAINAADTTNALAELGLAVQLRPDDAAGRYLFGLTLAAAGKNVEAETHLRKSTELDAVFAAPHFALARVLEDEGKKADAAMEYRAFLDRSARVDAQRTEAKKRLAALGSA